MNASQSKLLLNAARKAVCFLPPDTRVYQDLKIALMAVSVPATAIPKAPPKEKCCFCEKTIDGESFPGFTKKLKARVACLPCALRYKANADRFAGWCDNDQRTSVFTTRDEMEYCACGGNASAHRKDKDGNLLECSHCGDCDHFHYQKEAA